MSSLEAILQRHPVWRGGTLAKNVAALPTGFPSLDAELPGGGWPRQGLTELLTDEAGIGGLERGIPALARPTRARDPRVWCRPPPGPPAPPPAPPGPALTPPPFATPPQPPA